MKAPTREEPKIVAAAERQMQAWARAAEIADRKPSREEVARAARDVRPYLTISREEGAGGSEVAESVGRNLGWEVLDRNLLDRVAERFDLPRPLLEVVDETGGNWLYDVLGTFMDRKIVASEKYVVHLGCVILATARQASLVLVGRGAQFLLPREKGLAVRIVAPVEHRIQRVMQSQGLAAEQARRLMQETDQGRRQFVTRYFHHDIADPQLYDLVINTQRLGVAGAAEQIVAAIGRL